MCDMPGGNAPEICQPLSHRSAVVLIPDAAVWEPIQQIRRSYDRQIRRWMPHVTLLYPFLEGLACETSLVALSRACASVSSFVVSLSRLSRFRHRSSHTIWLRPEPSDALRNLHKNLCAADPGCVHVWTHADGFTPHLTVGQVQGEEACDSLVEILQNEWTPLTFRGDRISVIAREDPPEDIFKVLYEIELGTGEMIEVDDGG